MVLFSHGIGGTRTSYSGICTELGSAVSKQSSALCGANLKMQHCQTAQLPAVVSVDPVTLLQRGSFQNTAASLCCSMRTGWTASSLTFGEEL